MSDTCCICSKPIDGDVLVERHNGFLKNWHPVCFAKVASAEIDALHARLEQQQKATAEARHKAQRLHNACFYSDSTLGQWEATRIRKETSWLKEEQE